MMVYGRGKAVLVVAKGEVVVVVVVTVTELEVGSVRCNQTLGKFQCLGYIIAGKNVV